MKTNVVQNSVIAMIGLLTCVSVFAQHVNGPDLKGTTIPVAADGEIPMESLQRAVTYCYKDGWGRMINLFLGRQEGFDLHPMTNQGVSEVSFYNRNPQYNINDYGNIAVNETIQELLKQGLSPFETYAHYTSHALPTDPEYVLNQALVLRPTDILRVRPRYDFNRYFFEVDLSTSLSYVMAVGSRSVFTAGYTFYSSGGEKEDRFDGRLEALGFPILMARIQDRSEFDELGNVVKSQKYVSDIQYVSTNPDANLGALPVRNGMTNIMLQNITFDAQAIINCVKAKIANP